MKPAVGPRGLRVPRAWIGRAKRGSIGCYNRAGDRRGRPGKRPPCGGPTQESEIAVIEPLLGAQEHPGGERGVGPYRVKAGQKREDHSGHDPSIRRKTDLLQRAGHGESPARFGREDDPAEEEGDRGQRRDRHEPEERTEGYRQNGRDRPEEGSEEGQRRHHQPGTHNAQAHVQKSSQG